MFPPNSMGRPNDLKQLNNSVWEFFKPPLHGDGVPKVEVIFFHGAQLSNDAEAFWKTWLSRDETVVWPTAWLAQKFPEARILFISYNSAVQKSNDSSGHVDMYQIMENLIHDIIWSSSCKVGQRCPVIFVGHCFGGIIVKQFLVRCTGLIGMEHGEDSRVREIREIKLLLQHCRAVFYYSTPHGGFRLMDGLAYRDNVHQSIVDFLEILSPYTSRINMEFNKLRHHPNLKWVCQGIGETLETNLKGSKKTMVVPPASALQDLDRIYWAHDADHFNVARAENDSSCTIFTMLRDLIIEYYNEPAPSLISSDEHYGIRKPNLDVEETPTSLLPFPQDNKYVPIVSSIDAVHNALASEHGCGVVTIHGETGLGKTSLVKYVALKYSPHHKLQGSREPSSLAVFPDGVFFLPCGQGGNHRIQHLQHELLQVLGCESEAVPVDISEESEGDYIRRLRRRLQLKLRNLKALIILDDVCERLVLQQLIVSSDEARSVKYLLTSQIIGIWPDAIKIQMDRPTLEEAEQILLQYLNRSSAETSLPQNIKEVADKIINLAVRIPFVIATLGAQLGQVGEDIMDVEVWQSILTNSIRCLNRPTSFKSIDGTMYQGTYWSALKRSIDGLGEQEKKIFFLVCICKGPFIPQGILQFFGNIVSSCDHIQFVQWKAELKRRHLVLEENRSYLSIRPLTKRLVAEYMHDTLKSIVQSLVKIAPHTLRDVPGTFIQKAIIVLLCLYLDAEFGEPLALQIGVTFDTLGEAMRRTTEPIMELLVSEIISSGSWTGRLHKSAVQVFLDFTCEDEVDDDHISQLLGLQLLGCANVVVKTVQFLQNAALLEGSLWQRNTTRRVPKSLLRIFQYNTHLDFEVQAAETLATLCNRNELVVDSHGSTDGVLQQMVHSLSQDQNPHLQWRAIIFISVAAYLFADKRSMGFLKLFHPKVLPTLLHNLVNLVKSEDHSQNLALVEAVVTTLVNLTAIEDIKIKAEIACFPNLLESLAVSLSKIQTPNLQEYAALALRNLASADTSIKQKILDFPELFDNLVKCMVQDNSYELARQVAGAIAGLASGSDPTIKHKMACFPTLLQSLAVSLPKDENPPLQTNAATTLCHLALADEQLKDKILDVSGLLDNLVKSMDQTHNLDLGRWSARTIGNLAMSHDRIIKHQIACFPTLLQVLIVSLSKDQNPTLQVNAARALCNLASGDDRLKEKILDVSGLLDNLVKSMVQEHNLDLAHLSAGTIANLGSSQDHTIVPKIACFPTLLEVLKVSLSKDQNPSLQTNAGRALCNLACGDDQLKEKVVDVSGLLDTLVKSMVQEHNLDLAHWSARAIANLISKLDLKILQKIACFPTLLEVLKVSLSKDKNPSLQTNAGRALCTLAYGDDRLKEKILDVCGLLDNLVKSMVQEHNLDLAWWSAGTIGNLGSTEDHTIGQKIACFPTLLEVLKVSLSKDQNPSLQMNAGRALYNLACGDDQLKEKILDVSGLLDNLVKSMVQEHNLDLAHWSAGTIGNLGSSRDHTIEQKIACFPTLLEVLKVSLSKDQNPSLQTNAGRALYNLASGKDRLKEKILDVSGLLDNLVKSMVQEHNLDLAHWSAGTIANLGSSRYHTIKQKIACFPTLLEVLKVSLSKDQNPTLQMNAAQALRNLGHSDATGKFALVRKLLHGWSM